MEIIENEDVTVNISEMSWHFSAPVIAAFKDMGLPIPSGLISFFLKLLSNNVVRDGTTDFLMIGLALRIVKENNNFTVDLIEVRDAGE
jgi:hypothetical protein